MEGDWTLVSVEATAVLASADETRPQSLVQLAARRSHTTRRQALGASCERKTKFASKPRHKCVEIPEKLPAWDEYGCGCVCVYSFGVHTHLDQREFTDKELRE